MHKIGLQYETTLTVNEQHTAKTMGSGELDVFSTPTMVALMEEAAWRCAAPALEEGQGTVGTSMNVQHISSTPRRYESQSKSDYRRGKRARAGVLYRSTR